MSPLAKGMSLSKGKLHLTIFHGAVSAPRAGISVLYNGNILLVCGLYTRSILAIYMKYVSDIRVSAGSFNCPISCLSVSSSVGLSFLRAWKLCDIYFPSLFRSGQNHAQTEVGFAYVMWLLSN